MKVCGSLILELVICLVAIAVVGTTMLQLTIAERRLADTERRAADLQVLQNCAARRRAGVAVGLPVGWDEARRPIGDGRAWITWRSPAGATLTILAEMEK